MKTAPASYWQKSLIATNSFFLSRVRIGRTLSNARLQKKKKTLDKKKTKKRRFRVHTNLSFGETTAKLWNTASTTTGNDAAHSRSSMEPEGRKKIEGLGFSPSLFIAEQPRPFACFARKTPPICFFSPFYKPASSCNPVHVKVLCSSVASQTEAGEKKKSKTWDVGYRWQKKKHSAMKTVLTQTHSTQK